MTQKVPQALVEITGPLPTGNEVLGRVIVESMPSIFGITQNRPPIMVFTLNPFGKGLLTTDGVQYSAEVSGIDATYTAIETAVIKQPVGYTLEQIEFGLTVAAKSSAAAESVLWKFQASDAGSSWTDMIAEQTRAASCAAYADLTISGRWAPTGYFSGTGPLFYIRAVIASGAAAGETATGKMKNSSYITMTYRLT